MTSPCLMICCALQNTFLSRLTMMIQDLKHSLAFSNLWKVLSVPSKHQGAVMAQLASARLSEREVPGSIFSDFNVCFDFPLIRVAVALNTRKTEH